MDFLSVTFFSYKTVMVISYILKRMNIIQALFIKLISTTFDYDIRTGFALNVWHPFI